MTLPLPPRPHSTSENISYKRHTNSSAVRWHSSSACADSLASIIKDKRIVVAGVASLGVEESAPAAPEVPTSVD